jgi:hypothetical protein
MSSKFENIEYPPLAKESRGKKSVIRLVVPFKTYKDELREKYLSNTTVLKSNLKTRMCNSVDKKVFCPHGGNCNFAHNLEELVTHSCFFKDNCRFVRINKKGKLVNDGSNICKNKHPHETQNEFMERTGLDKYKTQHEETQHEETQHEETQHEETQHEEINVDEVEDPKIEDPKIEAPKIEAPKIKSFVCDRQTNYNSAAAIKSNLSPAPTPFSGSVPVSFKFGDSAPTPFSGSVSFKFGGPVPVPSPTQSKFGGPVPAPFRGSVSEKEIVLRVPKELAIQALEMAINSGNRCIRVEVVE